MEDEPHQARLAREVMRDATAIVIPMTVLAELVWVLRRLYRYDRTEIASALRALMATEKIELNVPFVEAGLPAFEAGSDFADGIIAAEGQRMGGEEFVTFDTAAAEALSKDGVPVRHLS